jgi:hypothetical protein
MNNTPPNGSLLINIRGADRGFFSLFLETLRKIAHANATGMLYHVVWPSTCAYTDQARQGDGTNPWLNYFGNTSPLIEDTNPKYVFPYFTHHKIWSRNHFRYLHRVAFDPVWRACTVIELIAKHVAVSDSERVLGVHIRRTDHSIEVEPVPIEAYIAILNERIARNGYTKLFVATDERAIIDRLSESLNGVTLLLNDVYRSSDGGAVHMRSDGTNGFQLGVEALADVYCLSKCAEVVLCDSNLSYAVPIFNPNIQFTLLRYDRKNKNQSYNVFLFASSYVKHMLFMITHRKHGYWVNQWIYFIRKTNV